AYTPDADFLGEDAFSYYATGGESNSNEVQVLITVHPEPNEAPIVITDSYEITENQILTIDDTDGVLANDEDPDGDALTSELKTDVSHGTLTLKPDGSFTYQPNP